MSPLWRVAFAVDSVLGTEAAGNAEPALLRPALLFSRTAVVWRDKLLVQYTKIRFIVVHPKAADLTSHSQSEWTKGGT